MDWSTEFETGILRIDDAHRRIFRLVADYREAVIGGNGARVYPDFLRVLGTFLRAHFDHEEQCMTSFGCSAAAINVRAHAVLIKELCRFQSLYAKDGFSSDHALDLLALMDTWLSDHICAVDIKLRDFRVD